MLFNISLLDFFLTVKGVLAGSQAGFGERAILRSALCILGCFAIGFSTTTGHDDFIDRRRRKRVAEAGSPRGKEDDHEPAQQPVRPFRLLSHRRSGFLAGLLLHIVTTAHQDDADQQKCEQSHPAGHWQQCAYGGCL